MTQGSHASIDKLCGTKRNANDYAEYHLYFPNGNQFFFYSW